MVTMEAFEVPGDEYPYKLRGTSRLRGRVLGIVIYGYKTVEERATHLRAEGTILLRVR